MVIEKDIEKQIGEPGCLVGFKPVACVRAARVAFRLWPRYR